MSQNGTTPNASSGNQPTIERLSGKGTTYSSFYLHHLIENRPCLLSPSLVKDWNAFEHWTGPGAHEEGCEDSHRLSPVFVNLAERYSDHSVPVVVSSCVAKGESPEEALEERTQMSVAEAVEVMKDGRQSGRKKVYIKDWHLIRSERQKGVSRSEEPYQVPSLFADDWMNNSQSPEDDDFRFCYAGSAGSQTMLHRDDTSYSWSTNIVGQKRWRLFPPIAQSHLRRFPKIESSQLASSVDDMAKLATEGKLGNYKDGLAGWTEWPLAMQHCQEVVQNAGETIFVPSDWYHEVMNLTDCVSINHNWCNSTNIASMYRAICKEVEQVEEALVDVREMMKQQYGDDSDKTDWRFEWTETVQKVLIANSGWGWKAFWDMIQYNLSQPPCSAEFRPSATYVLAELKPCLLDFQTRLDYPFLGDAVQRSSHLCSLLLPDDWREG
ncbi:hypothetical protein CBS101457_004643 [Exobasidium rhododendri]|nr:hypothetical protein CBS101457_004643 [Exobasidium rhododendri]